MDRCDRCCAAPVAEWWKAELRRRLQFCGHHDREHSPALEVRGWLRLSRLDPNADTLTRQATP